MKEWNIDIQKNPIEAPGQQIDSGHIKLHQSVRPFQADDDRNFDRNI